MRLLSVLSLVSTALCFSPEKTWANVALSRQVDLSKSYITESSTIEIKNLDDAPNREYYLSVPNYVWDKISTVSVYALNNKDEPLPVEYLTESGDSANGPVVNFVKVSLPPVAPKSTFKLAVIMSITNVLEPLPAKVGLVDEQTLVLRYVKKPLSAYDTERSELIFLGVSEATELTEDDENRGVVKKGALVFTFDETKAFESSPLALLYKHNVPLLKVNKLNRGIWVSHWHNTLQFVEEYETTNEGAQLDKGFSRADFMLNKNAMRSSHAATAMELGLESNARDVFYTDLVGNVSTSKVVGENLYIKPRFPVFGGWHYNFTVGWTNTLGDYLTKLTGDEYIVTIPFLNGPPGTSYDEVDLNVYLPEGAEVLSVECPLRTQSEELGYELSYFDLGNGHTKVSMQFKNMVDSLGKVEVTIKYRFGMAEFLIKPLIAAKYLAIALVAYFALTKVDITLKAKK